MTTTGRSRSTSPRTAPASTTTPTPRAAWMTLSGWTTSAATSAPPRRPSATASISVATTSGHCWTTSSGPTATAGGSAWCTSTTGPRTASPSAAPTGTGTSSPPTPPALAVPSARPSLEYGVAYATVRRAVAVLRERGLIVTIHGRGAFAAASLRDGNYLWISISGGSFPPGEGENCHRSSFTRNYGPGVRGVRRAGGALILAACGGRRQQRGVRCFWRLPLGRWPDWCRGG